MSGNSDVTTPSKRQCKLEAAKRRHVLAALKKVDREQYETVQNFTKDQWKQMFRKLRLSPKGSPDATQTSHVNAAQASTYIKTEPLSLDPVPSTLALSNETSETLNTTLSNDPLPSTSTNFITKSNINSGRAMKISTFSNYSRCSVTQSTDITGVTQVIIKGPMSQALASDETWLLTHDYTEPIQISEYSYENQVLRRHVINHGTSCTLTTEPDCLRLSVKGNLIDTTISIRLSLLGDFIFITYEPPKKESTSETETRRDIEQKMNKAMKDGKKRPFTETEKKTKQNKKPKLDKQINEVESIKVLLNRFRKQNNTVENFQPNLCNSELDSDDD